MSCCPKCGKFLSSSGGAASSNTSSSRSSYSCTPSEGNTYRQKAWSRPKEFNRVAMSDVARDHGISPIRPDGDLSHAFTKHNPGNQISSKKGEGSEFYTNRSTLDSRAENYNANAQYIAETREAATKAGSGNFKIDTLHTHSSDMGRAWGADNKKSTSSSSTFGVVWDHTSGLFRELTGFLRKEK